MPTSGSGSASGVITPPSAPVSTGVGRELYPTVGDLESALTGIAGLDSGRMLVAIRAGIAQFEKETGRHFIAGLDIQNGAVGTAPRYFAPAPCQSISIPDLWSVTSVQYQPQGTTAETWVTPDDYMLVSSIEGSADPPYRAIELARYLTWPSRYTLRRSVVITGLWGYGERLPEDAWQAMVYAGMANYLGIRRLTAGGGFPLKSWTAPGGVSETFDTSFGEQMALAYTMAVDHYRRLDL